MNKYLKRHEELRDRWTTQENALIDAIQHDLLIPFCNRTGLRFTAGMGTWSFDKPNRWNTGKDWYGSDHKPPGISKTLYDLLREGSACRLNDLGSLMQDYTPPNYKG